MSHLTTTVHITVTQLTRATLLVGRWNVWCRGRAGSKV